MDFSVKEVASMLDLSVVQAEHSVDDVRKLAALAKQYQVAAVFMLPAMTTIAKDFLSGENDPLLGGVVGFPSGADFTEDKVITTKRLIDLGCRELDMVINIGKLRSGLYDDVRSDISQVKDAAGDIPLKVILECHHLNLKELEQGCRLAEEGGASWVKTGTGWAPTGATPECVSLMRSFVSDKVSLKAAGGVRDLDTVKELYHLGVRRFGVGLNSGEAILREALGQ